MQEIKLPNQIEYIYHISDIHIRNIKRHKEYKLVFDRLYENIINQNKKNSIICLLGDIAHAKTDISPELIDLISGLFRRLADIHPTFLIMGNHDTNLNNSNRLDALTPIVNAINHPNFYYLKYSDEYKINNISLSVFSLLDTNWIKANKIESDNKICLFHGSLKESSVDSGYKLTKSEISKSIFNGYDMVLLGDIHKHQTLQSYSKLSIDIPKTDIDSYLSKGYQRINNKLVLTKPCIKYAGSLIQQDYGENPTEHGYLLWDIKDRTSTFHKIINDYGYYTIDIQSGKLPKNLTLSSKPRIRLNLKDTSITEKDKLIQQLKEEYKIDEIVTSNASIIESQDSKNELIYNIKNIQNIDYQNEIIIEYLKKTNSLFSDYDLLKQINKETNNEILSLDTVQLGKIYKLKKLEFSNLFRYAEGNIINFDNINGITGLFAQNSGGKSSIIDVILFTLFDKTSRSYKGIDVINIDKLNFYTRLVFEYDDGNEYVIEKTGTRIKAPNGEPSVKVNINFSKVDSNEPTGFKNLNGEQRRDTNSIIKTYVGNYENAISTSFSLQFKNEGLIEKSHSERNAMFSNFLGLDILERLFNVAKTKTNELKTILKEYSKKELIHDQSELSKSNIELNKQLSIENENLKLIESKLTDLNTQKDIYKEQIINIVDTPDIDKLQQKRTNVNKQIKTLTNTITTHKNTLIEIANMVKPINEKLSNYDLEKINSNIETLNNKRSDLTKYNSILIKKETSLKHKKGKLDKLKDLKYDSNCSFCMGNVFVKDAINTKSTMMVDISEYKDVKSKVDLLKIEIKELEKQETLKSEHDKLLKEKTDSKNKYESITNQIILIESNVNTNNKLLEACNNDIDTYYKNEEIIMVNKKLSDNISIINNKISNFNIQREETYKKITDYKLKIQSNITKIESIKSQINTIKEKEKLYNVYKTYSTVLNKDGLQLELIRQSLPVFENNVNSILTQIVDFKLTFVLDKRNINIYINYDDGRKWNIEMCGGMEKFISTTITRIALSKISTIPMLDCLFIDEGFSVLDFDNFSNLPTLFSYLKNYYRFLFIISHDDKMRDNVESILDINIDGKYSHINFN